MKLMGTSLEDVVDALPDFTPVKCGRASHEQTPFHCTRRLR